MEKANDMCNSLLILCRWNFSWPLNSFILKLYENVYSTSNMVVDECSGGGVWCSCGCCVKSIMGLSQKLRWPKIST